MIHRRGFTIVEIIIVLSIISLLAAVVLGNIISSRDTARDTARFSDLEQIQIALRLYAEQFGTYPPSSATGQIGVGGAIDTELARFLPSVPRDPRHDGSTFYYYYDQAVNCGGSDRVVIYARNMETDQYRTGPASGCVGDASATEARTIVVAQTPS